jgi:hypothetical protein
MQNSFRADFSGEEGSTATTTACPPGGSRVEHRVLQDKTHGTQTKSVAIHERRIMVAEKIQKPRQQKLKRGRGKKRMSSKGSCPRPVKRATTRRPHRDGTKTHKPTLATNRDQVK